MVVQKLNGVVLKLNPEAVTAANADPFFTCYSRQ